MAADKDSASLPTEQRRDHDGSQPPNGILAGASKDVPLSLLQTIGRVLTPEIFQRRKPVARRVGPTAWLDGLRGWAAFSVCIFHMLSFTHSGIEMCYGQGYYWSTWNYSPLSLPIIRVFFMGGHIAVMTFFTISGYVVPRRLISLLHENRKEEFVENLNSALIRRPLRLWLPALWTTLSFAMSWHIFGIATPWPLHQSNILYEFLHWCYQSTQFLFFWRLHPWYHFYNLHTWTIPVEIQGSYFILVWLFLLHQTSHRFRLIATLLMTLYLGILAGAGFYAASFAGMFTAELDMIVSEGWQVKLPWDGFARTLKANPNTRMILSYVVLILGCLLAGQPSADSLEMQYVMGGCPGFRDLVHLIPPSYVDDPPSSRYRWFWLFWAAWGILVGIKDIGWIKRLFETTFSQYLGRISFCLYLCHGPLIGIFSERLFYLTGVKTPGDQILQEKFGHLVNKWHDASWWPFPDGGPYGLEPNFLFCVFVSVPIFLYVAEVATRLFDERSATVAAWTYKKLKSLR